MVKSLIIKTGLIFFLSFLQQSLYPQVIVPKVIPDKDFNVCWLVSILHSLHPITSFREALKDFAATGDKKSKNYSFNQKLNDFLVKLDSQNITPEDFDPFKQLMSAYIFPGELVQERDLKVSWESLKPLFFAQHDGFKSAIGSKKPDANNHWDSVFGWIIKDRNDNKLYIYRANVSLKDGFVYYPPFFVINILMTTQEVLEKYKVSTLDNEEIDYELKSLVQGGTGHAVAYVKYGQDWYCYDTCSYPPPSSKNNNPQPFNPLEPKKIEDIEPILKSNQKRSVLAFYSQVQPELEQKNDGQSELEQKSDGQLSWLISMIRCLYSLNSLKAVLNNFTHAKKDYNSLEGLIQTAFNTFDEELSIDSHQLKKIKEAMVARLNNPSWKDDHWKDQQINLHQFWMMNLFSDMNFLSYDSNQECKKLFEYKVDGLPDLSSQFLWKASNLGLMDKNLRKQLNLLILNEGPVNHTTKPKLIDLHSLKSFMIKDSSHHSVAYIKYSEGWYCYDTHAQGRKKIEDNAIKNILDSSNKNYLQGLFFYEQDDQLQGKLVNLSDRLKQLKKKLNQLKDKLGDIRKKLNHPV